MAPYTVALGVFASPSSSPRFLARNAETLARFMHRSEQYRLVLLVLVSMNTPWQPAKRGEVVAGDAGVQVLAVGDQDAQPVEVGEPVTVLAPGTGRVHEPYREFSVGVEIHSRSLAARPELREVGGVMACCRYRVL